MTATNVKETALKLIDRLPDDISRDELVYRIEVRASIERGLAAAEAGRLIPREEVKKHFGITR